MTAPAQKNINKLYAIAALEGVVFYYAIDKIFMQARGLSLTELVAIEILYGTIVVLTEVPSGALSDRWSRKKVLALASLFFALNTFVWAISHSFTLFAIGVVFGALYSTFRSGTDTSILYDSLKELGKSEQYEKYLGKQRAISAVALLVAAIAGGFIAQNYSMEAALWWTLPSAILAGLIALSLHEPIFHRSTGEVSYWQHIANTFTFLSKRPRLIHVASVLIAITVPMLLIDEFGQVYFTFVGISLFGLGLLAAFGSGIDATFNVIAHKLSSIRHNLLFALCFLLMSTGFLVAGLFQNVIGIAFLFLGSAVFYIVAILAESDINRQLSSTIRATSESFFSLAEKLMYIPIALAFAWVGEQYSIATSYSLLGFIVLIYLVVYLFRSYKVIGRGSKKIIE